MQVDVQHHVGDLGLRQVLERQQGLFVVRGLLLHVEVVLVVVQDVGVVEDEAAEPERGDHPAGQQQARAAAQPPGQPRQTGPQPALRPPPPQAIGQHQQHQRDRRPIADGTTTPPRRRCRSAVHVGQRHARWCEA